MDNNIFNLEIKLLLNLNSGEPDIQGGTKVCVSIGPEDGIPQAFAFSTQLCTEPQYALCRVRKGTVSSNTYH